MGKRREIQTTPDEDLWAIQAQIHLSATFLFLGDSMRVPDAVSSAH